MGLGSATTAILRGPGAFVMVIAILREPGLRVTATAILQSSGGGASTRLLGRSFSDMKIYRGSSLYEDN